MGEPDDIAWGVVYLASEESKFMTGAQLVIDGGYTARGSPSKACASTRPRCVRRARVANGPAELNRTHWSLTQIRADG